MTFWRPDVLTTSVPSATKAFEKTTDLQIVTSLFCVETPEDAQSEKCIVRVFVLLVSQMATQGVLTHEHFSANIAANHRKSDKVPHVPEDFPGEHFVRFLDHGELDALSWGFGWSSGKVSDQQSSCFWHLVVAELKDFIVTVQTTAGESVLWVMQIGGEKVDTHSTGKSGVERNCREVRQYVHPGSREHHGVDVKLLNELNRGFPENHVKTHKGSKASKWRVEVGEVGVNWGVIVELEEKMLLVISRNDRALRIKHNVRVVLVPGKNAQKSTSAELFLRTTQKGPRAAATLTRVKLPLEA